ncbi:MAG: polyphosphate kinase [Rhodothermales bacterium]|jgi:polyphosphate kinase
MSESDSTNPTEALSINRELSWLSFNERVLQEAEDPSVPLADRLRFVAIYSSNLDEFFRVRVALLRTLERLGKKRQARLSSRPKVVLKAIHKTVVRQQERLGRLYETELIPRLADHGVRILAAQDLTESHRAYLRPWFDKEVLPLLNPEILDSSCKAAFLTNGALYLVAGGDSNGDLTESDLRFGLVEIPSGDLPRFVPLPEEDGTFPVLFLDDAVRLFLADIFPSFPIVESYAVKLTRDADLNLDDEYSSDIVTLIREGLARRDAGPPTRLLFDERIPARLLASIQHWLGLSTAHLVPGGRYHNLHDFWGFPMRGLEEELLPALIPNERPDLDDAPTLFHAMDERDRLLSFPYESFDHVVRFFREAAEDPAVTKIWITLYRVARDSAIVGSLVAAAKSGTEVTAFVEPFARFDEENNLEAAERMKAAGVNVILGKTGVKVHAKLALVERRTGTENRLYAWLGTGNFNESTARIYADHGILTSDVRLTQDVRRFFQMLADKDDQVAYDHLLVAPNTMRRGLNKLIDRERRNAKKGLPSGITIKVNSLEDPKLISRLVRAAESGVPVSLVVRGICCLNPHGTDIAARSIVDRFLEHARILIFENAGEPRVFLSSADWMQRSMVRRIEVAFPVLDEALRARVIELVNLQLRDNTKARDLGDAANGYAGGDGARVRAQMDAVELLA